MLPTSEIQYHAASSADSSADFWPLKMEVIGSSETVLYPQKMATFLTVAHSNITVYSRAIKNYLTAIWLFS
jgi:hypothetical protein